MVEECTSLQQPETFGLEKQKAAVNFVLQVLASIYTHHATED